MISSSVAAKVIKLSFSVLQQNFSTDIQDRFGVKKIKSEWFNLNVMCWSRWISLKIKNVLAFKNFFDRKIFSFFISN